MEYRWLFPSCLALLETFRTRPIHVPIKLVHVRRYVWNRRFAVEDPEGKFIHSVLALRITFSTILLAYLRGAILHFDRSLP